MVVEPSHINQSMYQMFENGGPCRPKQGVLRQISPAFRSSNCVLARVDLEPLDGNGKVATGHL
jgi:hypothetical protein